MEKELQEIDFSRLSRVQASLKERLLASYDGGLCPLADDELDMVAAAGNSHLDMIRQADGKIR